MCSSIFQGISENNLYRKQIIKHLFNKLMKVIKIKIMYIYLSYFMLNYLKQE